MNAAEHEQNLVKRIDGIGQFSANGLRAPHKPLLLLLALTKAAAGSKREILFAEEEERLRSLLEIAGNRKPRPEFPFFYLKNDGLWILGQGNKEDIVLDKGPSAAFFRREGIWGAFPKADYQFLKENPQCTQRLVNHILAKHFPESIFEEILTVLADAAPAPLRAPTVVTWQVSKAPRPASFRQEVLIAYQYRCALCGFGLSLGDKKIGVEAAHIRWHAMGGPGEVKNGLALCYQHHKLFDLGIFTIHNDQTVEVSRLANGWSRESHQIRTGLSLAQFPDDEESRPSAEYLKWHQENVFKV